MNCSCRFALALWLAASPLAAHAQGSRADDLEKLGENAGVFNAHLRRRPQPSAPKPSQPKPVVRPPPAAPTAEQIREAREARAARERKVAERREQRAKAAAREEQEKRERLAALKKDGDPTPSKPSPSAAPVNVADKPGPDEPTVAATPSATPSPAATEFASLSPEERGRKLGLLATQVADAAIDEAP